MNKELIAAFMETITAERGAAANTIAAYTCDLENCGEFLDSGRRTFENAQVSDLRAYLAFLAETACPSKRKPDGCRLCANSINIFIRKNPHRQSDRRFGLPQNRQILAEIFVRRRNQPPV